MAEDRIPQRKRLRVAFLLADRFTLSAFANFVDVLRLAADEADKSRQILCEWTVISSDMAPIRSSCGVRLQPDIRPRNAGHYDYIVVVGGLIGDQSALSPDMTAFLKARAQAGTPLVGLCTGVFILYEEGLLEGYRCCVSWFHHQDFIDRFEMAPPVADQLFVVDRDRLTCSGGHGTSHLAAYLVQRHIGAPAAAKSLNIMMIDSALSGERPQPGQHLARHAKDPLVKRAILRMQQYIEFPKTIEELSGDLEVARRTLERRFTADLGLSPQKIYLELRLDRAIARLRNSEETIAEIALSCGFCDTPHLSRVMKAERGMTPAQYRRTRLEPAQPAASEPPVPSPDADAPGETGTRSSL
ncbi:GlxA family transcriptional regulator [Roseibium litorale]|uniref:GlxA family transcriptional regulator n=1 Tax=Roseibium litorale TaxID=2803841 RepID=A0ABR9CN68_9HYPH|nr:GlxA family transcriptional regulator [Roseibium litorale]MBD8892138.1 GlxA family transcriptional regulator [Roseibium litorale]